MESFINFEGCLNDDWLVNPAVSNFNDGMLNKKYILLKDIYFKRTV
jgi:hypothetical protein